MCFHSAKPTSTTINPPSSPRHVSISPIKSSPALTNSPSASTKPPSAPTANRRGFVTDKHIPPTSLQPLWDVVQLARLFCGQQSFFSLSNASYVMPAHKTVCVCREDLSPCT